MKIVLLLCVGLVAISTTEACGQCETQHPQQHYCDADFVMKLRIDEVSRDSDIENTNLITAEVISSLKRGPANGEFQFYNEASFCGTNFAIGRIYVVTGMKEKDLYGSKYWMHGSCDFAADWDDMSGQQKTGFKKEYKKNCDDCSIVSARSAYNLKVEDLVNDYQEATTFWTPTNCYYNPHKTQIYKQTSNDLVEDCEDEYGVCAMDRKGQCSWQLTADYEECFKTRDDYVMVSSGEFAITDISQCDSLPNRKKRRNCRKRFNAQMVSEEVFRF